MSLFHYIYRQNQYKKTEACFTILIEEGDEYGPYGAKSVGEIAINGIAPAVINAINHTLGINITTLPATPERIVKTLKEKSLNLG